MYSKTGPTDLKNWRSFHFVLGFGVCISVFHLLLVQHGRQMPLAVTCFYLVLQLLLVAEDGSQHLFPPSH